MSERFKQLSARHSSLRDRCALQRQELSQQAQQIERHLSGVDRAVNAVRAVARSPLLIVGGIATIALLRPRRLVRWASRGALFYSTARRFWRSRT
jgi:hypothetical protein